MGAKTKGKNLYILDEPTAGLNSKDIELLEKNLLKLNQENEVDLGRNAGNKGGETIIQGKPIEVVRNVESSWNKPRSLINQRFLGFVLAKCLQ